MALNSFTGSKILFPKLERNLLKKFDNYDKPKILYIGSVNNFKYDPFIKACKNIRNTLCFVKTKRGKIFGMYTDIGWGDDRSFQKFKNNSYIFRVNEDYSIKEYKKTGFQAEVFHSKNAVFYMNHPVAIQHDSKTSNAYLDS